MSLLGNDYAPDPMSMGLLGMGSALMTPRAMGGGVGPGMNAFVQQAMAAQMQRQQMQRQQQQDELQRKLLELRLSEATESAEDRKRRRDAEAKISQAAMGAYTPAMPGAGDENNPYVPVPDTPALFNRQRFVNNLYGAGMPGEAMRIEDSLRQEAPIAKLNPGDFTPESWQAFESSGYRNTAALRRFVPPEKPATPTEIEKLIEARNRLPAGSPDRALIQQRIDALNYRQPPASLNVSYGAPFTGVDPNTGREMLYQPSNRGGPPQTTGLAPPPKPAEQPAEAERVAAGYAGRMMAAEQIMKRVGEQGYPSLVRETAAELPLTGGRLAPVARTREQQLYRQAQEDWVRAKLRKESGAVIGEEEMAREIKTYFPQPLEPRDLAAQKAQARQQAIAGMRSSAGRAPIPQADGAAPQSFPMLPNARDFDGKIATDRQNGNRYKSVNGRWVEVQ